MTFDFSQILDRASVSLTLRMGSALCQKHLIPPRQNVVAARCQEKVGVIHVNCVLRKKKVVKTLQSFSRKAENET